MNDEDTTIGVTEECTLQGRTLGEIRQLSLDDVNVGQWWI